MALDLEPFDGLDDMRSAFSRGVRPIIDMLVSEWSDAKRILDKPFTKKRMRWRTDYVPYTKEPMDCLSPSSPVRRVTWMKSAQVAGTEVGNCWVGFVIQHAPGLMMLVNPTKSMVKRTSARIQALIDSSPGLNELVLPARSRDSGNTQVMKKFPGGLLVMVGAQSGPDLRSFACQYLFFDEADAFPPDVDGEGSPITVAEGRTYGQGERYKIYINSTPKIEQTSLILVEWKRGDQRHYHMPCPFSGRLIRFEFKNLRLEVEGRPETVKYHCTCGCGQAISEGAHKTAMLAAGVWVPRTIWSNEEAMERLQQGDRSELETFNAGSLERSYHINALYSPIGMMSWKRVMELWFAAQGRPELLKAFTNTVLGMPWHEIGEAPDWEVLYGRRDDYRQREIPDGVVMLTAGADIGQDHIEVSVYGWGRRRERWLIEHIRIDGPYNEAGTWARLDDFLERRYEHPSGAIMAVRRMCIDRGKWPDVVDAWVHGKDRARVTAVKGYDFLDTPFRWSGAKKQHSDGTQGKTYAVRWALAGVSHLKLELMGVLNLRRETDEGYPAGWIHMPTDVTEGWLRQLVSERLVYKTAKGGRRRRAWEENGSERHEALDCTIYARVAASIEGWDDWSEIDFQREADHLAEMAEDRRVRLYEWQQTHRGTTIDDAVPGLVRPVEVPEFATEAGLQDMPAPVTPPIAATDRPQIGIVGSTRVITEIPMPSYDLGGGNGDD